jgi:NAD(P)-dependent dehydrogenase (short-subunit alcohol dehydrogenase family)
VDAAAGDATDEATIKALVARAIEDEGRLDVFFANAGNSWHITSASRETFIFF